MGCFKRGANHSKFDVRDFWSFDYFMIIWLFLWLFDYFVIFWLFFDYLIIRLFCDYLIILWLFDEMSVIISSDLSLGFKHDYSLGLNLQVWLLILPSEEFLYRLVLLKCIAITITSSTGKYLLNYTIDVYEGFLCFLSHWIGFWHPSLPIKSRFLICAFQNGFFA